jgi:hypothetical protein
MTDEDVKLADQIFEEQWPIFLGKNDPERLNHHNWNIPPIGGLKESIFTMMEQYHKMKGNDDPESVNSKLAFISGLVQGMNTYLHERLH